LATAATAATCPCGVVFNSDATQAADFGSTGRDCASQAQGVTGSSDP
jgi:hypothetical protein